MASSREQPLPAGKVKSLLLRQKKVRNFGLFSCFRVLSTQTSTQTASERFNESLHLFGAVPHPRCRHMRNLSIVNAGLECPMLQDKDLIPDHGDYADILWAGIEAENMDKAIRKLSYREQTLLKQRSAICMACGRVSDISTRASFETLAALFEGSRASGAERAYKRAVENLILELVRLGQLHCVRLKQISTHREGKKITAAIYAYQVDNDGAWSKIQFDLEKRNGLGGNIR